jgi:cobalt-zinc-cadmium efflux system membrane fusion protein
MSETPKEASSRPPVVLPRTSWLRSVITTAVALGVAVGAIVMGLGWPERKAARAASARGVAVNPEQNQIAFATGAPQWHFVKVGTVEPVKARRTERIPGRVRIDESRAARVGTPLPGRVTRVFVELGQRVTKGTPLFAVASPDLATLKVEREKADLDYELAKKTLDRVVELVKARAAPLKEELEARKQFQAAALSVKLANLKLTALRVDGGSRNEFVVVSPLDGVVADKNVLVEQIVSPENGHTLILVADLSVVRIEAQLPQAQATEIALGAEARITWPSAPGEIIVGKVDQISAVVDARRYTVAIRSKVDNASGKLRANMFVEVAFGIQPEPRMVEVPARAIVSNGPAQAVFVETSPGNFVKRRVVADSAREGVVPIRSGLRAGERIAVRGAIFLDNQLELAR